MAGDPLSNIVRRQRPRGRRGDRKALGGSRLDPPGDAPARRRPGGGSLAGCLDLSLVREVAFPPSVTGLDRDQPWVPLPVGAWLTDGEVQAKAVAACLSGCAVPAVVGVFDARGRSAADLVTAAASPERLARVLREGRRATQPPRPELKAEVAAEAIRDGAFSGVLVRLSRPTALAPRSASA
jgi:hypothetical protein